MNSRGDIRAEGGVRTNTKAWQPRGHSNGCGCGGGGGGQIEADNTNMRMPVMSD